MIPELVQLAFDRFCLDSKTYWQYEEFATAIQELYEADGPVAERFRDAVLQTSERHFQELTVDSASYEAFWQAAEETPRFAVELMRKMSPLLAPLNKDNVYRRRFRCPSCKSIFRARMAGRTFTHACRGRLESGYMVSPETWEEHAVDP